MTAPTPPRYRRWDGVIVEAIQSTADTTLDLCAWVPPHKLRLVDNAGTPAMYVQTMDDQARVWLGYWVVRYPDDKFDVMNDGRFTNMFTAVSEEQTEPTASTVEPESADADYDAQMLAALSKGHGAARNAASYWAEVAETLTKLRAEADLYHLPSLPDGAEEWYETRTPTLPFDDDELAAELGALSGLITKAYTISAIYDRAATHLDDEYASVAPD